MARGGYFGGSTLWTGREMSTRLDYTDKSGPNGQSKKSMSLLASEDPLLKALGIQLADTEIMTVRHLEKRCQVAEGTDLDYWNLELKALNELRLEIETVIDTLNAKNRRKARHYVKTDSYRRLDYRLWELKRDFRLAMNLKGRKATY